jgi:hypothetical protein
MSNSGISRPKVVALGTDAHEQPYFIVRDNLEDLRTVLETVEALDQVAVYDGNCSKISNAFSADSKIHASASPKVSHEVPDDDWRKFYAHLAAVLASQAALAAEIASGDESPRTAPESKKKCTCCWCWIGIPC